MPAVSAFDLIKPSRSETSETVAQRVSRARAIQIQRYSALSLEPSLTNAYCSAKLIEQVAEPDASGLKLLRDASEQMRFSARAYHRILRVARTLADLDGSDKVGRIHLASAISYRMGAERLVSAA
jgi:magnesium chelatase family protein